MTTAPYQVMCSAQVTTVIYPGKKTDDFNLTL